MLQQETFLRKLKGLAPRTSRLQVPAAKRPILNTPYQL